MPHTSSSVSPSAPTSGPVQTPLNGAAKGAESGPAGVLNPSDTFVHRHIGPSAAEIDEMLAALGYRSLDELTDATVPASIKLRKPLALSGAAAAGRERGEFELLQELKQIAQQNKVYRSFIGMGYSDTITPPVILRNIMENPGWYTQYTPYQAEISQGRLEALLNFQTMIADLTGLPLAGASLLDEGTAAAEAMAMCFSIAGGREGSKHAFFVAQDCHPQTISVVQTRAESLGIRVVVGDPASVDFSKGDLCGVLVQYPTTDGRIECYEELCGLAHGAGAMVVAAADLLALTLLKPPGEWGGGGADIVVGSAQRFGVPMGFGGPHAAFIATKSEHARKMPGRIIGVSRDAQGNPALRMAIQTREQHIKRERATSNICTAQALLAIMAGMYACYHGPEGLRRIALRTHLMTCTLARGLGRLKHPVGDGAFFDTLTVHAFGDAHAVCDAAERRGINLRRYGRPGESGHEAFGVSIDETTTLDDIREILAAIVDAYPELGPVPEVAELAKAVATTIPAVFSRTSGYLTHPVFNTYHSETEMLRYITKLQGRDLSLAQSMIPLGSCTMKLNATSEMIPVTWPEFGRIHPFAPADQTKGYAKLFTDLESWLAEITGFAAVSLQPNAGSQGEYAGLMVIRAYHHARGEAHRDICLIPDSAHGTNPASAVIAGMQVVPVATTDHGDIDVADLKAKAAEHGPRLAALMVTYPSTHGVFEDGIREICEIVHKHGGQVYMDGANMNAQVGLTSPGFIGADVCHLNLHKTFCIPHGGGGPGMGPIGVAAHLAPFLPGHPVRKPFELLAESRHARGVDGVGARAIGPISAAPFGSASILTISWVYIALMAAEGLKRATQVAILNANYMAKRLESHYPVLYTGQNGRVAHEFILDCRQFDKSAGVKIDDIAKRLMDYGFHAPTMSFPVPGTLMIEPTESESKPELDRLCDALISIRQEIADIESGSLDRADNPLKHAPHTIAALTSDDWSHKYPRKRAAYPLPYLHDHKFWPPVARVDNPYGDRNLVCVCPPMSSYAN